jgi:hypothetical protein
MAKVATTTFSPADLADRAIQRRAVEAINWGMPAVNLDLMLQAMIDSARGKPNQIVFWSRLPDWKIQTLTPNPDVIYLKPFFNTREVGPMVLEIPPADGGSITGTIMDAWQAALEDVGPAGVDKGKGGRYLILPPDFGGVPPSGSIALPSMTYRGYALLRSIPKSGTDVDVAGLSPTLSGSGFIPSRRPTIQRRLRLSTRSMWFKTRRFRITCAFFSHSTASCRTNLG